jgi:hypothetical protein
MIRQRGRHNCRPVISLAIGIPVRCYAPLQHATANTPRDPNLQPAALSSPTAAILYVTTDQRNRMPTFHYGRVLHRPPPLFSPRLQIVRAQRVRGLCGTLSGPPFEFRPRGARGRSIPPPLLLDRRTLTSRLLLTRRVNPAVNVHPLIYALALLLTDTRASQRLYPNYSSPTLFAPEPYIPQNIIHFYLDTLCLCSVSFQNANIGNVASQSTPPDRGVSRPHTSPFSSPWWPWCLDLP